MIATTDPRPRRLALAAAELAVVYDRAGGQLPPDFGCNVGDHDLDAAVASLSARGVLGPAGEIHPSVAANVSTLVAPELVVRTRAQHRRREVLAIHSVARVFGASLIRVDDRAAELSFFAAVDLGRELARVVPDGDGHDGPDMVVDLEALQRSDLVLGLTRTSGEAVLEELGFSADDRATARRVGERVHGVLHAMVLRPGSPPAGHVIWYAMAEGWMALRPEPSAGDRRMVRLVAVGRDELATCLAPIVEALLA